MIVGVVLGVAISTFICKIYLRRRRDYVPSVKYNSSPEDSEQGIYQNLQMYGYNPTVDEFRKSEFDYRINLMKSREIDSSNEVEFYCNTRKSLILDLTSGIKMVSNDSDSIHDDRTSIYNTPEMELRKSFINCDHNTYLSIKDDDDEEWLSHAKDDEDEPLKQEDNSDNHQSEVHEEPVSTLPRIVGMIPKSDKKEEIPIYRNGRELEKTNSGASLSTFRSHIVPLPPLRTSPNKS